jgi:hypothetical protein
MFHTITNTGSPGPTTRIVCSDAVQNLSAIFTNANGAPAIGAIITVEDENIRFTMGGNITTPTYPPTQGAAALGHVLFENQSLSLVSAKQVRTFQFINAVAQADAVIQVTPLFEIGA